MNVYTVLGSHEPICEECLVKLQKEATEAGQPILADEVAAVDFAICASCTKEDDLA